MCPNCRAFITTKDKICPYCDTPVAPRAVDLRSSGDLLGGLIPGARAVSMTILTLNLGLYVVTALASIKMGRGGGWTNIDPSVLLQFGASYPALVFGEHQWWRLITAGFLHGGLMHILFNTWALMDISAHAEEIYGPKRMTLIYLVSTMGGFTLSALSGKFSIGASAGLFGLIGAMIAVGVLHKSFEAAAIRAFYTRWAIYGILMGLLPFFRVDNMAHMGGLATGFVLAWLTGTASLNRRSMEPVWTVVLGVVLLMTAYAFFSMFLFLTKTSGMLG